MTNLKMIAVRTSLVLLIISAFSACGQKGPLTVERPPQQVNQDDDSETR